MNYHDNQILWYLCDDDYLPQNNVTKLSDPLHQFIRPLWGSMF